ncbi:MAG: hypothetical protein M5R36_04610 [Deltaproteobacteria bacterium]|nr:hypothetical protein [Deltaproteobacteria bacterium]
MWFADRRTRGPIIALCVSAGIAFIAAANASIWIVQAVSSDGWSPEATAAVTLSGLCLASGFFAYGMFRLYKRRRDQDPMTDLRTLVADRDSGSLRRLGGQHLAALAEIKVSVRLDLTDSTGGWMRVVTLRWRGAKRRIFKSGDKQAVKRLTAWLSERGIGVPNT